MGLVLYQQTTRQYLDEIRQRGDPNYVNDLGIPALCEVIYKFCSVQLVEELLKDGANVNSFTSMQRQGPFDDKTEHLFREWGNFSSLHMAVASGQFGIVQLLLDNGAEPNAKTTKGIHPLQILINSLDRCLTESQIEQVSEEEDLEILKLMVQYGSNVHVRYKTGETSLYWAISEGKNDIAKYLISVGCDVNHDDMLGSKPLHKINLNIESAKVLLENNADPNAQNSMEDTVCHQIILDIRNSGETDQGDLIRVLHRHHVDLNIINNHGKTVLHLCFEELGCTSGIELIQSILECGADPNIEDELGRTPAFYLFLNLMGSPQRWDLVNLPALIKLLIKHGLSWNKRDIMGLPLLHALIKGCLECPHLANVKRSMECINQAQDFDVNIKDYHNRTALHLVASEGIWVLADILLKHGADKDTKDCDGNSPLHVSIEYKQWEFAKWFLLHDFPSTNDAALTRSNCSSVVAMKSRSYPRSKTIQLGKESEHNFCIPSGSTSQWTIASLRAVGIYSCQQHSTLHTYISPCKRNHQTFLEARWRSTLPEPEMSVQFHDRISSTSLLETCEENSMGVFHLMEKCHEEKCQVAKQVFVLVNDLLEKSARIDPKLESSLLWTGSSAEGTKMWAPDEFDFMMELTKLKDQCKLEDSLLRSTVIVCEESEMLWSDLCMDRESLSESERHPLKLSPLKILRYVTALLGLAALSLDRGKYPNISFNLCQYPAITRREEHFITQTNVGIMLTFYWSGQKYKKLKINVDITPAIPVELLNEHKSELRNLALLEGNGNYCHVIPYMPLINSNEFWRVSFSLAELNLMKGMSRKDVRLYKCLKFLRDIYVGNVVDVPSYHLKCFCFDFVFGDKGKDLDRFNVYVRKALFLLYSRWDPMRRVCCVEHFFMTGKRLSLSNYDMRWCRDAYRNLMKSV